MAAAPYSVRRTISCRVCNFVVLNQLPLWFPQTQIWGVVTSVERDGNDIFTSRISSAIKRQKYTEAALSSGWWACYTLAGMVMRNFLTQSSLYLRWKCVNLIGDSANTCAFPVLWNFHISPPFLWWVFRSKSLVSLARDPGCRRLRYDAEYHSTGAKAVEYQTPLFSSKFTCISITEFFNEFNLCLLRTAYVSSRTARRKQPPRHEVRIKLYAIWGTWQVEPTVVGHPVGNGGNYIRFT